MTERESWYYNSGFLVGLSSGILIAIYCLHLVYVYSN